MWTRRVTARTMPPTMKFASPRSSGMMAQLAMEVSALRSENAELRAALSALDPRNARTSQQARGRGEELSALADRFFELAGALEHAESGIQLTGFSGEVHADVETVIVRLE